MLFRSFVAQFADIVLLFVDGQCFECVDDAMAFAEQLCAQPQIDVDPALIRSKPITALIAKLANQGSVAFEG